MKKTKIIQWLRLRKPLVVAIFKGRLFSQRHSDYMAGAKRRGELNQRKMFLEH